MHRFTREDLKNALDIVKGKEEIKKDEAPKQAGKTTAATIQENKGNALESKGLHQKAIACYREHLDIAEKVGDKDGVGRAHSNMGNCYKKIGKYQNAIECYRKHLEIAEELQDKCGVRRASANLGNAYDSIGEYQKAIDCHLKDLEIAEELEDKGGVGRAHANLGIAYRTIGQYQKAIECHCKDMEIAEELLDKAGVGRALGNLGIAYHGIGQYQKAIEYHSKYLKIAEQLGNNGRVGRAHANLGHTYNSIGQYEKAIECHCKHLEITEKLGDKGGVGRAHENLGSAYDNNGQYQKAIESYRKCLGIAEDLEDKARVGRSYSKMGCVFHRIGHYQKAIECHGKHLKIVEKYGTKREVGRGHLNLGNAYNNIGQYHTSIECHRKHLEIAQELKDKRGVGRAHGNLGNAYHNIGQYQKAIECHRKDLQIAEELEDRGGVGRANLNLGNAYSNVGRYQEAIELHRKHLDIAVELGDKAGVGKSYANMGNIYDSIGQYTKAIECHRKDFKIAEELGDRAGVGRAHANLGNAYHNIGQYQKAIECHRKHLQISRELGNKGGAGSAFANLGNAYDSIGQYQTAIEFHKKHFDMAEEQGNESGVGRACANLGISYYRLAQYQKSIECQLKALDIAEKQGNKGAVKIAHTNMGFAYHSLKQYQKAIVCGHVSLQIAKEIGDIRGEAKAQFMLGLCHQTFDDCLASSFFAKSILCFHSIRRSGIYDDPFNTTLSNLSNLMHKSLFVSLLNLNQMKAALLLSDGGKAKALFDLTRRCADVVLDLDLEDNYTLPIQQISENPSSKTAEALLNVTLSKVVNLSVQDGSIISYTFDRQDNLHAWVVSGKGVFHKVWQTMNVMSTKTYLKTINGGLRDNVVQDLPKNISFQPNAFTSLAGIKDKIVVLADIGENDNCKNNVARDLDKRVENLTGINNSRKMTKSDPNILFVKSLMERYNLDSSANTQCSFYDNLRENCEENGNDKEKFLGWCSLEMPNAAQSRARKETSHRDDSPEQITSIHIDSSMDTYLKKQYSIYISPIEEYLVGSKILVSPEGSLFKVPFCALLNSKNEHLCEKYSLQFTPGLYVLNSCLSKPLPKIGPALFVGNPTVGEVEFNGNVGSPSALPQATVEAKECSKFFNAEPLLEQKATKENVLNGMKDASIIHIAAHGHMDDADIFLAPSEGAPKPPSEEHYLLTAKDVVECTLVARLVVLSCCHSGRGQISAEGVVGIARSFLGAGARSVLVTLWKIPEEETKEFMKAFYDKVVRGVSVCVALQETMIELKEKFSFRAWAAYQIVGEDIVLSKDEIEEIRRLSSMR